MMLHPLEQKLVGLRRRALPLTVLHSVCLVSVSLLGAMAAMGLLDYLFRFQDRGLRIMATVFVLAVFAWAFYRRFLVLQRMRLGDNDLAKLIQRQFPVLGDQLVTAVEFLRAADDDPAAGSVALRRCVIAQVTAEAESLDFLQIIDCRPVIRVGIVTCVAYIAAVALLLMPNPSASIAISRLLRPFGDTAWPQRTNLTIRQPVDRIARGQEFQIEVIDARGANLPSEVCIHYRPLTPDGGTVEEIERMCLANGVMVTRRENVLRPFAYRVEGGDDRSMPWVEVEVVEPPAIESFSIRLFPPAYTGKQVSPSERHIRALVGTRVEFTGKTSKPLASITLCFESGRKLPVQLADDGCTFSVAAVVERSGAYWFELTDREGLRGGAGDRWQMLAIPDAPPSVRIDKPTAGLFVTPNAVVPLRILAKDDFALRNVALVFRLGESASKISLPLFTGPPQTSNATAAVESRTIDYRWNLAPLNLSPGTQVMFYAAADDYSPQSGKSDPRTLRIVTPDELRDRMADREKLLVAELERALTMQRVGRDQVESLRTRLSTRHHFEQSDVDRLQAAEHSQRDVNRVLTSRSEGVPMHLLALQADLDNNGIANADTRQRIVAILSELERLECEVIPPLGRDLIAVVKTAQVDREGQGSVAAISAVVKSLTDVAERQGQIIVSLQQQIGQLLRSNGYHQLHREIVQLIHDQEDEARRTSDVGRRTLTRELRDLSTQETAELTIAADRQFELARLLDRLLQDVERTTVELRKGNPTAAETVAGALDEAHPLAISGQMRTAGSQIQQNQIGHAAAAQKQILDDLRKVRDGLVHQRQNEVAGLDDDVKRLCRRQMDALAGTQRIHKLEESQGQLNRSDLFSLLELARMQQSLHADAVRLGQTLAGVGDLELAMLGAAAEMKKAAKSLGGRQTGPPTQDAQRQAIRQLDRLAEVLKNASPAESRSENNTGSSPSVTSKSPPDARRPAGEPRDKSNGSDTSKPGDNSSTAGSPPTTDKGATRKPDAAAAHAIMKRLWGSLPERQREKMLDSSIEEFPPKYELQIEDYFRRLSEEKRGE
jgi:hypothetical protein